MDRDDVVKALRRGPLEGLQAHELAAKMSADAKGKHRIRGLLQELLEEGVIEKGGGGRYRLAGMAEKAAAEAARKAARRGDEAGAPRGLALPKGQVAGSLRVHPAGYGFVVRDDGEDDVFVPARFRNNALDGDRVALSTWIGYKGTEGKVEAILERGRARLTGIFRGRGRDAHLEPDDPRIVASSAQIAIDGDSRGAREGQAVVVEITRYPKQAGDPLVGRVMRVLGEPDDPATEIEKVIVCSDIPDAFPRDVRDAGERAPTVVRPEDREDRVDLRDRAFMTIDPETARDFDDAVCIEPSPKAGHMRLWVAVADVSHYVRPGSALDREARVRGCSVYLPDRAIPMLPEQLSSGICSLNPEVDRLAMVVRMEIDQNGGISDPSFCAAVIRSRARLDYAGVAAALAGDLRGSRARYREFLPTLEKMMTLSSQIRALRTSRGALDFELPEAKVQLDEDDPRLVRDVVQSRSNPEVKRAYQMIEDFMLAANETVARHLRERKLDTVWRVHDVPSEERLEIFARVAESFGLKFKLTDDGSPKAMRDFLLSVRGKPMERALNFLALRTLKQAQYDTVNAGHFALAARDYVHFTSPIRRYPDLVVHRLLKHALHADGLPAGGPPGEKPTREELQARAQESSSAERRAMEAEREVVDMYRALLMRDRVGEELDGTIAGVAQFGMFVQIESPFVEGLVKAETLGDSFDVDDLGIKLVGRRSGQSFALGEPVRVRVENVSVQRRKIDLSLVEHKARQVRTPAATHHHRGPLPPRPKEIPRIPVRRGNTRRTRRR